MAYTRLNEYPIKFGYKTLFKPEKWEQKIEKISNPAVSEDGHDLLNIVRTNKMIISAEFSCTSDWKAFFERVYNTLETFELWQFEPDDTDLVNHGGYKSRTVRMEKYNASVEKQSEYTDKSTGLYTVTFELVEI